MLIISNPIILALFTKYIAHSVKYIAISAQLTYNIVEVKQNKNIKT